MTNKNILRLKLISRHMKGYWWLMAVSLIASVFEVIFAFLTPQVIRIVADSVIGTEPFSLPAFILRRVDTASLRELLRSNIILCLPVILAIAVLFGISVYIRRAAAAKGAEGFVKCLRDSLYRHIQYLPYQWHMENQTGDIIQRCTSDVELIRNFITNQMLELFRTIFLISFALGIMFSMNARLTWAAFAFIPVVIAYSGVYYMKIAKKFRFADEAEGELSSAVQENLTGVRVVRAFGREKLEVDRFDDKNEHFAMLWIRLGRVLGSYWGIGDLLTGFQILTVISLGVVEAVSGSITVGEFIVFAVYNSQLAWPIRGLGRILSEMSKASISIDRLNDILMAEEERSAEGALLPDMSGDIEFKNVNFSYKNSQSILKNINFKIEKGTTFAILGGTGSGKSTLVYLLDRLYDLPEGCGSITVGGVDIRNIKLDWIRKNIGMVLQEPFLFSRTIRKNIGIARPDLEFEHIRRAADVASVHDNILGFAAGYETVIGERGVTLSGGQKQRVAIARTLMQNAPIMVFDDSLSAVDAETDAKIRSSLKKHMKNATVILISHRITTLMQADKIMVLDKGRISQMGTHGQLIEQEGLYKEIYDIQRSSGDLLSAEEG